jgi:NAD(P)-dependent dehydrogenase (short-subunit alcohol dehydrogenase family)
MSILTTNHQPLATKIALITGATRGIGFAVAKRFAQEGAHVIATGRSVKGLEQLDDEIKALGGSATLVPLDLLETDKIEMMAQNIANRFGKLDILVGNAGVLGELTPMAHTSPEQWDKVIAINLTANYHLLRCFDMLLKLSEHPRAMFVSSGVTEGAYPYWGAYAVSKSALEKMVETYAAENAKTNLKANLIDPAAVRTKMRAAAFPGEDPQTLPHPDDITELFVTLASEELKETGKKFYV